jgi:hypothetical protein
MTVKLALLKSGEQVISDIKELVDESQKVISLVFENPYVVQFLTAELLYEGVSDNEGVGHKVSFSPWLPLSSDKTIAVSSDWVVSIIEPLEWIKRSYEEKMNLTVEGLVNPDLPISPESDEDYVSTEVLSEETNG